MEKLFELFYQTSGVFTDTRKVLKDGLFIALKGANFNGNAFASEAIKQGAKYAIVDEKEFTNNQTIFFVHDALTFLQKLANFHRKKFSIPIIGITGSNGKTTTKELIHQVLSSQYNTLATIGNLNNHIGVPLTLLLINESHEIAIVEMGANRLHDIVELCEIAEPTHGIITNIGAAHIEGFGSFEGVLKTKLELFESVEISNGVLVVNKDDQILCSNLPKNSSLAYYSINESCELQGQIESLNPCLNFTWKDENGKKHLVKTNLFGGYNLYNFLAAIRFGQLFKVPTEKINTSLALYTPSNNRSQITRTENNILLVDCYNANPSSMLSALTSFISTESQDKIAIIGDMLELGTEADTKHAEILELLNKNSTPYITVGTIFYHSTENKAIIKFEAANDLLAYLQSTQLKNKFILLKGSRGIALEKSINYL
jgi:UDP-N-acetylmuramoyl-tripeptide--D-alanyl-D-alanine ligase